MVYTSNGERETAQAARQVLADSFIWDMHPMMNGLTFIKC